MRPLTHRWFNGREKMGKSHRVEWPFWGTGFLGGHWETRGPSALRRSDQFHSRAQGWGTALSRGWLAGPWPWQHLPGSEGPPRHTCTGSHTHSLTGPAILRGGNLTVSRCRAHLQLLRGSNGLCEPKAFKILKFKVTSPLWKLPPCGQVPGSHHGHCCVRTSWRGRVGA